MQLASVGGSRAAEAIGPSYLCLPAYRAVTFALPNVQRFFTHHVLPAGGAVLSIQSPIHVMLSEEDGMASSARIQAENARCVRVRVRVRARARARARCAWIRDCDWASAICARRQVKEGERNARVEFEGTASGRQCLQHGSAVT